jgi:hypothetical protein
MRSIVIPGRADHVRAESTAEEIKAKYARLFKV